MKTQNSDANAVGEHRRRSTVRSLRLQLSIWEKLLLVLLGLEVLGLVVPQPAPTWLTKRRAAKFRAEITQLQGTRNVKDWSRLVALTKTPVAIRFPRPLDWLFIAGENKRAAIEVSVRGLAAQTLRDVLLKNHRTIAEGLTCGDAGVVAWMWSEIAPTSGRRDDQYTDILSSVLLYGRDDSTLRWVISGKRQGAVAAMPYPLAMDAYLRYHTVRKLTERDPALVLPVVQRMLTVAGDSAGQRPLVWARAWCEAKEREIRYSAVRLAHRAVNTDRKLAETIARAVRVVYMVLEENAAIGLFQRGLSARDWMMRHLFVYEAANARILRPRRLWLKALHDDTDWGCRIIAARVLVHQGAKESADAIAKLLDDRNAPVQIQAAWSLATLGDRRGREALRRWTTAKRDLVIADLPNCCGPLRLPYRGQKLQPRPRRAGVDGARLRSDIARSILAYVDAGGTMPLTISSYPKPGATSLKGVPAPIAW